MEKYYKEYGKFIIHFEEICFKLNYLIRCFCTKGNLFQDEDKQIEILLQGMTAQPILTKFKSIFLTTDYSENAELVEMINIFNNEFIKVIEYRNLLAHGTFFYGDPHGDINKFQVRNTKLNKNGFYDNVNTISIESLKKMNEDILKLRNFIECLIVYVISPSNPRIKNIVKEMKSSILNLEVTLKIESKSVQF
jgi:hypothetical protein